MAKFKFTDYGYYEAIANNDGFGVEEMKEWAEAKMELLEARKEKDKERARKKRLAGDELQAAVLEALNEEPQTIDMIVTACIEAGFDCSHNKVVNKLKNLVDGDKAIREDARIKVEDEDGNVKVRRVKVFRKA